MAALKLARSPVLGFSAAIFSCHLFSLLARRTKENSRSTVVFHEANAGSIIALIWVAYYAPLFTDYVARKFGRLFWPILFGSENNVPFKCWLETLRLSVATVLVRFSVRFLPTFQTSLYSRPRIIWVILVLIGRDPQPPKGIAASGETRMNLSVFSSRCMLPRKG